MVKGKSLNPLVIIGPTASGKTSLAIDFAKRSNGEIVSADSRQVYRGMDVGTGKLPLPKIKNQKSKIKITRPHRIRESVSGAADQKSKIFKGKGYWVQDGVKIWGYDLAEPDEIFTAFDFAQFARKTIKEIQSRGKFPILVGGTGFWIEMALGRIKPAKVPPDWKLRRQLEEYPAEILLEKLKSLDPKRAEALDPQNKRRLIRAIEIVLGAKPEAGIQKREKEESNSYNLILLTAPRRTLYERIDARVDQMIEAGLLEEIRGLLERGYSWDLPSLSGIGYRQFRPFIEGSKTLEECIQKLKFDTHAYARRQMTYFRRFKDAEVLEVVERMLE